MDFRRLNHMMVLAEERHFARAAERVCLSQPAFSRSIQALEQELGQRLFERSVGDVRPTPAGQFLIDRARQLLLDAKSVGRDMQLYGLSELGDIAFGMGPIPVATILPHVLSELRLRYPQVRVRVTEGHSTTLFEHLVAEDIEFFVADMRGLRQDVALDVQPLGRQYGGFFVRAEHPLAGKTVSAAEMWAMGVASVHLPASIKTELARFLNLPLGQNLQLALECDNVALLQDLALSTDIVLGLSYAAVRSNLLNHRLVQLQVCDLPDLFNEMGVVSLRNRSYSPIAQRVIGLIVSASKDIKSEFAELTRVSVGQP